MKAIATLKKCQSGSENSLYYEIKIGDKPVCALDLPNSEHPGTYMITFYEKYILRNIPYELAFKKVLEELHNMYGVTKITESKLGYPWELLEIFEDPLLADVKP